jgi:hypothetical protein
LLLRSLKVFFCLKVVSIIPSLPVDVREETALEDDGSEAKPSAAPAAKKKRTGGVSVNPSRCRLDCPLSSLILSWCRRKK